MDKRKIFVTKSSMPSLQEYIDEISPLWESHWLTNMGAKHQELTEALKSFLNVNNVTLFTNGHSALECILEAMELYGEVITTPFSFASTTHAIARKGLTPIFADIKQDDYTIDPDSIESLITPKTCAIVPVHVYGNLCDVNRIEEIAEKHNLKVIYDAAHAFGVQKNGISVATFGDASMFSFHATKVFNTIEGGAVCLKDPSLAKTLNYWKNFGITGPETVEYIGGNAKMNEFCAAMGLCNLKHYEREISKRKIVAKQYWKRLGNIPGVKLSIPSDDIKANYAYMPIVFEESYGASRNEVFDELAKNGIYARKYFYPLISDYACYRNIYSSSRTPTAKKIADSVLTLPMYADLAIDDVNRICDIIQQCAKIQS